MLQRRDYGQSPKEGWQRLIRSVSYYTNTPPPECVWVRDQVDKRPHAIMGTNVSLGRQFVNGGVVIKLIFVKEKSSFLIERQQGLLPRIDDPRM